MLHFILFHFVCWYYFCWRCYAEQLKEIWIYNSRFMAIWRKALDLPWCYGSLGIVTMKLQTLCPRVPELLDFFWLADCPYRTNVFAWKTDKRMYWRMITGHDMNQYTVIQYSSAYIHYKVIFRKALTHLPLVPHIYVGELGQHWFR